MAGIALLLCIPGGMTKSVYLQTCTDFSGWFWDQALAECYQLKPKDSHANKAFLSKERQISVGTGESISISIDSTSFKAKYSSHFAISFSKIEPWPSVLYQLVLQDDSHSFISFYCECGSGRCSSQHQDHQ